MNERRPISWPEAIRMAREASDRSDRRHREAAEADAIANREDDATGPAPAPSQRAVETPTQSPPSFPRKSAPQLLAVITRKSDGKQLVVVKRGGAPVHVSEVIPEVLATLTEKQSA
jgi:hypothetical protein